MTSTYPMFLHFSKQSCVVVYMITMKAVKTSDHSRQPFIGCVVANDIHRFLVIAVWHKQVTALNEER